MRLRTGYTGKNIRFGVSQAPAADLFSIQQQAQLFAKTVGENLQKIREGKHIKQATLAELAGYSSRATLARYEAGEIPGIAALYTFTKLLGVSVADLITERGEIK